MGSITVCSATQLQQRYGQTPPLNPPWVDERVLNAARAIMRAGWRVTSIYRPDGGHHSQGIALDVAPLIYTTGRFGPKTALHMLRELIRVGEQGPWLVVSERDHVHIQVHDRNAYGWQPQRGELYITNL